MDLRVTLIKVIFVINMYIVVLELSKINSRKYIGIKLNKIELLTSITEG